MRCLDLGVLFFADFTFDIVMGHYFINLAI